MENPNCTWNIDYRMVQIECDGSCPSVCDGYEIETQVWECCGACSGARICGWEEAPPGQEFPLAIHFIYSCSCQGSNGEQVCSQGSPIDVIFGDADYCLCKSGT
ncbi:MAG: hypothetical protein AMXMBFR83_07410 [Phycisphaerae bacterium]